MEHYKPIYCLRVVYKSIAKILANCISQVLLNIIDPPQTTFVKGRRITDEIGLAQEFAIGFNKKNALWRTLISGTLVVCPRNCGLVYVAGAQSEAQTQWIQIQGGDDLHNYHRIPGGEIQINTQISVREDRAMLQ